jgi:hypothetical protein
MEQTMATKQITTKSGKTITVELVRKVQDKTNYCDGQNVSTSREIVEYTNITMCDTNGKILTTGKSIITPSNIPAEMKSKGAVASIGNAYIPQEIVDIVTTALNELDAENPKSAEQVEIENAKAQAEAQYSAWVNSPEQIAARKFEREMNSANSDF